jgi:hypothetical protein
VIGLLRIAQRYIVERRLRITGLDAHDGLGRSLCLRLVVAGEGEQTLQVGTILLARFFEACIVLQVVVTIGHAERAGVVLCDRERRIVGIGIGQHDERRRDLHLVQRGDGLLQIRLRADRIDLRQ